MGAGISSRARQVHREKQFSSEGARETGPLSLVGVSGLRAALGVDRVLEGAWLFMEIYFVYLIFAGGFFFRGINNIVLVNRKS